MASYDSLIPVHVITGFLGSGKTTLLQVLLRSPALADTAVLVNEFGEVGLDHNLIEHVDEQTILLQSGCVCCSIRGDLKDAIRDLFSRRERGLIPPFTRLVVETTGLADPVPVAYTVLTEPVIQHHFRLGNIITTVDAVNGAGQLAQYEESVKQVAIADRLVLTKTDLAEPESLVPLRSQLRQLNHAAPMMEPGWDRLQPELFLLQDAYDGQRKAAEISGWMANDAPNPPSSLTQHHHAVDIQSFTLTFDHPLNWTAFGIWMTMLLHTHGERVLRLKGMLNVEGVASPVVVQGVQHIVHPPTHLDKWPGTDRRSHLVFIVRGVESKLLTDSLQTFNRLCNPDHGEVNSTVTNIR